MGTGKVYFFYCGTMQKYLKTIPYKSNSKEKAKHSVMDPKFKNNWGRWDKPNRYYSNLAVFDPGCKLKQN